jgi:hypothetical protein
MKPDLPALGYLNYLLPFAFINFTPPYTLNTYLTTDDNTYVTSVTANLLNQKHGASNALGHRPCLIKWPATDSHKTPYELHGMLGKGHCERLRIYITDRY